MQPLQRQQLGSKLPIIHLIYLNGSSLLTAKEKQFLNQTDITLLSLKCSAVTQLECSSIGLCVSVFILVLCACAAVFVWSVVIQCGYEGGYLRERSASLNLLSLVASQCPLCNCPA